MKLLQSILGMLCLCGLLIFSSCGDDPETQGNLDLRLFGSANGEQFLLLEDMQYPGLSSLSFFDLKFYVSEIQLIGAEETIDALDVGYFNLGNNHGTAATAVNGESIPLGEFSTGKYTGIKMRVGLSETMNDANPADYPAANPLSNTEHYWDWKGEYIFAKIEGRADTIGDGTGLIFPLFHCGGDDMSVVITLNKDFEILEGSTTQFDLDLAIEKIFDNGTDPIDLKVDTRSESGADVYDLAKKVFANLAGAISVKN